MAAQTISVNRNLDEAAVLGLLNGETITINTNATLTCNSDSRWGQQAAVLGNVTMDDTTGGEAILDATEVWWIPYDAGTGNVPALGTVNVNDVTGSVAGVGEFLGIWTALGVAPSAAASAMPVTGFLKLRRKTADFADNEVITLTGGATVTVNSATGGERGWLHFVGGETTTITVPRLGRFKALGDNVNMFYLGKTNGADDQTFQYYVADHCPKFYMETGEGTGVYDEWVCAGTTRWGQVANRVATDSRGKLFGCTTAGVITIARRATNTCGFKPPANCRIYVPNAHVSSSTSANWALNTISTTLTTRWDFTTISAGDIQLRGFNGTWYPSFSQAYAVSVVDCGIADQLLIAECATNSVLTRVGVSLTAAASTAPLSVTSNFSGTAQTDGAFLRYDNETGGVGSAFTDCDNVQSLRGKYLCFGDNTAATLNRGAGGTGCVTFTRCTNSKCKDTIFIGASARAVTSEIEFENCYYADKIEGAVTNSTNPVSAIDISGGAKGIRVNGWGGNLDGIASIGPYNALVTINGAYENLVENIASAASPYNCDTITAGIVAFTGNSGDNIARRGYCTNTRVAAVTDTNSDFRNSIINMWGDAADTGLVLNGLNYTEAKGLRSTNPTVGSTAVYGTHFYDTFASATEGRVVFLANEPTALSAAKLAITAGTPKFSSVGTCLMPTVGDQLTWTRDYFCLGSTSLANAAPTFSGTNSGNFLIEYQIDTGSGFSAWKTASGANLSGETITSTGGFKLKLRATVVTPSSTNAIANIRVTTVTNSTDYVTQYPLPFNANYSIGPFTANTRLQIYNQTTAAEIFNGVVATTSKSVDYYNGTGISSGNIIRVRGALTPAGGGTAYLPFEYFAIASAAGFSVLVSQVTWDVYNTWGIDGVSITDYAPDGANIDIDIVGAASGLKTELAAWWASYVYSADGIANFWNAYTLESVNSIRQNVDAISVVLQKTSVGNFIFTDNNVRYYRSDFSIPYDTTGNSIFMDYSGTPFAIETGTSGLTAGESAQLADIVSVKATTDKVDGLIENVTGNRFTAKALEQAPSSSGSGATLGEIEGSLILAKEASVQTILTETQSHPTLAEINASTILAKEATLAIKLNTASYVAPDNAAITSIKVKTDNLPVAPASEGIVTAVGNLVNALNDITTAQIRTELSVELAAVLAVKAKTDNLPSDPADQSLIMEAIDALPTASEIKTEMETTGSKTDKIDKKTNIIPALL